LAAAATSDEDEQKRGDAFVDIQTNDHGGARVGRTACDHPDWLPQYRHGEVFHDHGTILGPGYLCMHTSCSLVLFNRFAESDRSVELREGAGACAGS
jgi:hypothetical protein